MVTVTVQCSVLLMVTHPAVFSDPYGHCHSAVFSAPYGHCHCAVFSAPYGHSPCSVQCSLWSLSLCSVQCSLWSLSLYSVQCSLWSLSLCSVQCSLWSLKLCTAQCSLCSLSLCSLPPLCSYNDRPQSPYSLTSKPCSSQSLLPFQHNVVPNILQSMSTAIKPQPSLHPRFCFLSPKLSQNFHSNSITFTAPL